MLIQRLHKKFSEQLAPVLTAYLDKQQACVIYLPTESPFTWSLPLAAVTQEGKDTAQPLERLLGYIHAPLYGLVDTDRWGLNGKLTARRCPQKESLHYA